MSALTRGTQFATLMACLWAGCGEVSDVPTEGAPDELAQTVAPAPRPTRELATRELELDFPVALRGTGSATIHATVYENPRLVVGQTVLAVHGLAETGKTFGPLANSLFSQLTGTVRRIVAIDLVGHGKSSYPRNLPEGVQFGALTIDDNVSVVLQSIEALRARALAPQIIMGHSMGGLAVQAVQEALLAQGSSLAKQGIREAVLLAPVPPNGRPWTQPTGADVSAFIVQDPALGAYVALPPPVWLGQAFTTLSGTQVTNAPTPEQVIERGYIGNEPLVTLLQLVGAPIPLPDGSTTTIPRPTVRERAFALQNGTLLTLVSFAQDTLVPAADLGGLYTHLTGDTRALRYVPVTTADSVHSMFISNPAALLQVTPLPL